MIFLSKDQTTIFLNINQVKRQSRILLLNNQPQTRFIKKSIKN